MPTKPRHKSSLKAKTYLDRVSKEHKSPSLIHVAEMMILQGKHESAIKQLEELQCLYEKSYRFNLVLARIYRDAGDLASAKRYYEIACQLAPQNEVAIKELIELLSEQRDAMNKANEEDDPSLDLFLEEASRGLFSPEERAPTLDEGIFVAKSTEDTKPDDEVAAEESGYEQQKSSLQSEQFEPVSSPASQSSTEMEAHTPEGVGTSASSETESAEPAALMHPESEPQASGLFSEEKPSETESAEPAALMHPESEPQASGTFPKEDPSTHLDVPSALPQGLAPDEELDPSHLFTAEDEKQLSDSSASESDQVNDDTPLAKPDVPSIKEEMPFTVLGEKPEQSEPNELFSDKAVGENVTDLFLPDEQGNKADVDPQSSNSADFSYSAISSEALQREAIRMLEEEQGLIPDDPFVDFDGKKPDMDMPDANDPKAVNPLSNDASDFLSAAEQTSVFEEMNAPSAASSDSLSHPKDEEMQSDETVSQIGQLFKDDTSEEMPSVPKNASPPADDVTPQTPSSAEDVDIFADDFEFSFDKEKLANALLNLQSSGTKKTADGGKKSTDTVAQAPNSPAQAPQDSRLNIDELAQNLSNVNLAPIEETNDPTPISEQRRPFSDDEEIKTPSKSLAEIFVSQGAYTKAIQVYQALSEKNPNNAAEYAAAIEAILQKMNQM